MDRRQSWSFPGLSRSPDSALQAWDSARGMTQLIFMLRESNLPPVSIDKRPFFTRYTTSLWIRFLRFSLLSNKRLQDDLERLDLTLPQFYVLATIGYAGGLPFGGIGEKMMVTVSNLTGIVDRLGGKGIVAPEREVH